MAIPREQEVLCEPLPIEDVAPLPMVVVRAEKEARCFADERGVDVGLVAEFCGGRGTGRFGMVTVYDVRRYLGE
jgi:hypothetical protein